MKEDDFIKALMYSIEKSYEYGCINNELLDAEVLNSIELKEYKVDDKKLSTFNDVKCSIKDKYRTLHEK